MLVSVILAQLLKKPYAGSKTCRYHLCTTIEKLYIGNGASRYHIEVLVGVILV